jgi:hypothetical protein
MTGSFDETSVVFQPSQSPTTNADCVYAYHNARDAVANVGAALHLILQLRQTAQSAGRLRTEKEEEPA